MVAILPAVNVIDGSSSNVTLLTAAPTTAAAVATTSVVIASSGAATDQFFCAGNAKVTDLLKKDAEIIALSLKSSHAKYDVSAFKYEITSQSGDSAVVKATGNFTLVTDKGTTMTGDFETTTLQMKYENGWKVCGLSTKP